MFCLGICFAFGRKWGSSASFNGMESSLLSSMHPSCNATYVYVISYVHIYSHALMTNMLLVMDLCYIHPCYYCVKWFLFDEKLCYLWHICVTYVYVIYCAKWFLFDEKLCYIWYICVILLFPMILVAWWKTLFCRITRKILNCKIEHYMKRLQG